MLFEVGGLGEGGHCFCYDSGLGLQACGVGEMGMWFCVVC